MLDMKMFLRPLRNDQMTGVVGIFSSGDTLVKAAEKVRDGQYVHFDAFTPFPIHGLEDAMGLKRSFLPYVTFGAGITGVTIGLAMQILTSAVNWPINVGGKPMVSLPAFIPVAFELTILLAGLATAFTMLFWNRLPNLNPTIIAESITNDRFALFISVFDKTHLVLQMIN